MRGAVGLSGRRRGVEADGQRARLRVVGKRPVALPGPSARRAAGPRRQHQGALVLRHPVGSAASVDAAGILAPAVAGRARIAEAHDEVAVFAAGLEAGGADDVVLAGADRVDHAVQGDDAGDAVADAPVVGADAVGTGVGGDFHRRTRAAAVADQDDVARRRREEAIDLACQPVAPLERRGARIALTRRGAARITDFPVVHQERVGGVGGMKSRRRCRVEIGARAVGDDGDAGMRGLVGRDPGRKRGVHGGVQIRERIVSAHAAAGAVVDAVHVQDVELDGDRLGRTRAAQQQRRHQGCRHQSCRARDRHGRPTRMPQSSHRNSRSVPVSVPSRNEKVARARAARVAAWSGLARTVSRRRRGLAMAPRQKSA